MYTAIKYSIRMYFACRCIIYICDNCYHTCTKGRIFQSCNVIINVEYNLQSIGVEISPSTACLSLDSNFQLAQGEGVLQGSICEVIDSVTFIHYTDPTPPNSVSGNILISGVSRSEPHTNHSYEKLLYLRIQGFI
jgi:hypothetical protein